MDSWFLYQWHITITYRLLAIIYVSLYVLYCLFPLGITLSSTIALELAYNKFLHSNLWSFDSLSFSVTGDCPILHAVGTPFKKSWLCPWIRLWIHSCFICKSHFIGELHHEYIPCPPGTKTYCSCGSCVLFVSMHGLM